MQEYVLWYQELGMQDVPRVGGKNASLGEMISNLANAGVQVPGGFATTADAFNEFLEQSGLNSKIHDILDTLDVDDVNTLAKVGAEIRQWIIDTPFQPNLDQAIRDAYSQLHGDASQDVSFAVRSSATAEDMPDASFAGQQETFLNVRGIDSVMTAIKHVFASLFNDRAISYRVHQGYDHRGVALSAGIQRMVRSDKAASGVMFSIDTESGFEDVVFVTSSYGLGEMVVQGAVNPDEFYVHKPTLANGKPSVVRRNIGSKAIQMIYSADESHGKQVEIVDVDESLSNQFSLTDEEVQSLAKQAVIIEKHYQPGGTIIRAMAAKLLSGGMIKPHTDKHPSFHYGHRIHIPITTNPRVRFMIDGRPHELGVGKVYEINNQQKSFVLPLKSTENGKYKIRGATIRDTHQFENLTSSGIISHSSNIGMAKLSDRIDEDTFYRYLRDYGFGNLTSIDLPGETNGMLKKPKNYSNVSKKFISFGYEIGVTPLQLITAYCALVNGGDLLQPFIVKSIIKPNGEIIKSFSRNKIRSVISEKTSKRVIEMMKDVVEEGSGVEAKLSNIQVAGKTGTSQRLVNKEYSSSSYNSSFVGFFPAENPKYITLIVVKAPKIGRYGGKVAAPIFHEIASRIVDSDKT